MVAPDSALSSCPGLLPVAANFPLKCAQFSQKGWLVSTCVSTLRYDGLNHSLVVETLMKHWCQMQLQTVYIVERSLSLRRSLAIALKQEGDFQVISTSDHIDSVLHRGVEPGPQVIVLDDGAEDRALEDVIRQINARYPTARIVILTSDHQDFVWGRLRSLGVWAVLRKPFTLDELFAALRGRSRSTKSIAWCL